MNFYRSVIGSGVGSDKDYLTTVDDVVYYPTGAGFFEGQTSPISGDGIEIGDEITNCYGMFRSVEFNNNAILKNIHIGNNVVDCTRFMATAYAYNFINAYSRQDVDFDVNITFPMSVEHLDYAFVDTARSQGGITGNIYINNRYVRSNNMFQYKNNTKRVNVFCPNVSWIMSDNPYGWTEMTNGYYSQYYNVYLYNNYTGT